MTENKRLSLQDFTAILREAQEAFEKGDFEMIAIINARLSYLDSGLYFEDGESYLTSLSKSGPLPFEDK